MPYKRNKLISLTLCLLLLLEQSGFAQTVSLNLSNYLSQAPKPSVSDTFRPLHLRYLSYDNSSQNFQLLLDKGSAPHNSKPALEQVTQELLKYFFIGLTLPNEKFWVNLRPDSPDDILDPDLEKTDIGRIFLEADVQLKKDTSGMTSPRTPEGKQYWDKLYKKAGELFGSENITIPTLTRPWIVPDEVIIRESPEGAYIYKATLKVMLEEDYLKSPGRQVTKSPGSLEESNPNFQPLTSNYSFSDPRLKELNEYSTQLIKETIIPKLTRQINTSKRYAPLRQVYYSLILAQWFKQSHQVTGSQSHQLPKNPYIKLIDSGKLITPNFSLLTQQPYDKQAYFKQYQQSFKDGEYNLQESIHAPMGQSIRRYMSGGMQMDCSSKIEGIPAREPFLQRFILPPFTFLAALTVAWPLWSATADAGGPLVKSVKPSGVLVFQPLTVKKESETNRRDNDYLNKLWLEEEKAPTPVENINREENIKADLTWMKAVLQFNGDEKEALKRINELSANSHIKMYLTGLVFYSKYLENQSGKIPLEKKNNYYQQAERYIKELVENYSQDSVDRENKINNFLKDMVERIDGKPTLNIKNTIKKGEIIIMVRATVFALRLLIDKHASEIGWRKSIEENKDDVTRILTAYVRRNTIQANSIHEYGEDLLTDYDITVFLWYVIHEFGHIDTENIVKLSDGDRKLDDALGELSADYLAFIIMEDILGLKGTIERVMNLKGWEHSFEQGRTTADKNDDTQTITEKHNAARTQEWIIRRFLEKKEKWSNGIEKELYKRTQQIILDMAFNRFPEDYIYLHEVASRLLKSLGSVVSQQTISKKEKEGFIGILHSIIVVPPENKYLKMPQNKSGSSPMQNPPASSAVVNEKMQHCIDKMAKAIFDPKTGKLVDNFTLEDMPPGITVEKLTGGNRGNPVYKLSRENKDIVVKFFPITKESLFNIELEGLKRGKNHPLFQQLIASKEYADMPVGYIITEFIPGKSFFVDTEPWGFMEYQNKLKSYSNTLKKEFEGIPQEHWEQLVLMYREADEFKITIDSNPANLKYDKTKGFTALDYFPTGKDIGFRHSLDGEIIYKVTGISEHMFGENNELVDLIKNNIEKAKKTINKKIKTGGIDLSRINKSMRMESVSSLGSGGGSSPVDVDFDLNDELTQLQKLLNAEIIPSADRLKRYAYAARASSFSSSESADSAFSLVAETFRLQEDNAISASLELKDLAAWLEQAG